ncbi:anti-sigma factor [Metabacillus litoralis]|uniref:anti-sigma factor n=1 Tax=Metabacillus litoralis TaxID=152268 RepID=UPI001CFDCCBB|nr:anti-sigma factor [Metabacillus litoralis]
MTEWNKDKEKKILVKYRFTLTVRIIRVILACLFLFWIYMMVVNISYSYFQSDRKHTYYSKLATDWTVPNLYEDFGGIVDSEITPFLTQKISYPVSRMVGKENKIVGEIHINKTLFSLFSTKSIAFDQNQQEEGYRFFLPEHPETGKKLTAEGANGVWTNLEKIHEGTVAEISFSTSEFMTAEELLYLLKPYDLDILWAPLYTGEFKAFEPSSYGGGGESISVLDTYGLTGGRETENDYMSESKIQLLDEQYLEENKEMMLSNMERLLKNESTSYYENFLGLYFLQERYDYLKQNGFQVYGAVVTGPVKELLKLKDVKEIRGVSLGELDYWNWE